MALIDQENRVLFLVLMAVPSLAAVNDPFPIGYSMSTFGTILCANSLAGRQPWTPAAFMADSNRWGLGSAFVDYYAEMDNLPGEHFRQSAIGGWFSARKITVKSAYFYFNALNVYFEQKGFLSVGTACIPHVNLSAELEGSQAGLRRSLDERESMAAAGISLWIPWSFASVSLRCEHLSLKKAYADGFARPPTISVGLHSAANRYGNQGVLFEIIPGAQTRIRFQLGMEYWIHAVCGLNASLCTEPRMFAVGAVFRLPASGFYAGLVHHPALGWSKGLGMEYVGTGRCRSIRQ
jgi:hypothetical protein